MTEPLRLVDTHVHFFDRDGDTGLAWDWAERPLESGLLPDLAAVRARRFLPPDLWAEGGRLGGLTKCVHVQAADESSDPVLETRWLGELRERFGAPHAAVVRVPLGGPDANATLEAQCAFEWVRGVRDLGAARRLSDGDYGDRVRELGERGLVFEVVCGPRRFGAVAALASRCPQTTIVVDHLGLPSVPGSEPFRLWCDALPVLGAYDNVHVKLSGLGLSDRAWDASFVNAVVGRCLAAVGPKRCVVGSNFPIERATGSYPDVVQAIAKALGTLSAQEREQVLAANAEALYRV